MQVNYPPADVSSSLSHLAYGRRQAYLITHLLRAAVDCTVAAADTQSVSRQENVQLLSRPLCDGVGLRALLY